MNKQEIIEKIKNNFPNVNVTESAETNLLDIISDKDNIYTLCKFLKNNLGYDYLQFLTCIDRQDKLELQYHIYSYGHKGKVIVKANVERINGKVKSAASVWKTADWHERETYDLFGVIFEGHPGLSRILLEDDFQGHPLLKDFAGKNVIKLPKT